MAHDLTASQARTVSTTDQVIYNEIDTISRAIYTDALAGNLQTTVDDGTLMTESTPIVTVTSSGAGAFTPGNTAVFAGTTVTFGDGVNDGTGLDQAVADINNAAITGLTASHNGSEITLTYECPQSVWSITLAEGKGALAELGFTPGTTSATNPESVDYYSVWTGQTVDRKSSYEFAQVVNHFQDLGYNILAKQNTNSAVATFMWEVYW